MHGVRVENSGSTCPPRTPLARIINRQRRPPAATRPGEPDAPSSVVSVPEHTRVDWSRLNPGEWLPLICVPGHLPKRATLTDRGC